ncbi:helix-turn-helix domain-containing protein [Bacillus smithii]|uniref:helix-turn-helix domain-containing protein n=1 Tax=Bacillus smithii TaxID=1479 RepID=UPI00077BB4DC|nr:helix-turn-helix transcriptional regulator [Bacillus smithii]
MTYLKKIRENLNFTQEDVAQAIGTTIRQYQRIEAGLSFCNQEKLNKLEDFFQLPQRILFARNYEEIPSYYRKFLNYCKYKALFE